MMTELVQRYLFCVMLGLFTTLAAANSAAQSGVQHLSGVFGIITQTQRGKREFEESNIVPSLVGQTYGWRIELGPDVSSVVWKEVFELPRSPTSWGPGESSGDLQVSEDRTVSITEKEVQVVDGMIQNYWHVVRGDPLGDYVISVYVNDVLLETFEFKVIGE